MRTICWAWATRSPAVFLLCLSVLANHLSHSTPQHEQRHQSQRRVEAQQLCHPLEHSVPDPIPLSFGTYSSLSSPPLPPTSPKLQLLRRNSRAHAHNHSIKTGKKHQRELNEHSGSGSNPDRVHSEHTSSNAKKSRKKTSSLSKPSSMKQNGTTKKADDNRHGGSTEKKAKAGDINMTSKNKKQGSPRRNLKKASSKTFRQSTYHKHGKQYLFSYEDWYTQYRRNRSGPNSVMRKLTLESSRRRKAVATIEPAEPLDDDDDDSVGSIEQEFGSPNALPGSLRGNGVVAGQDIEEEGTENSDDSESENNTTEIQAVKRLPAVGAGLVPRPVIVRPAGLIPKARSNEGSSTRATSSRKAAARTGAIALFVALALLCSGAPFLGTVEAAV